MTLSAFLAELMRPCAWTPYRLTKTFGPRWEPLVRELEQLGLVRFYQRGRSHKYFKAV